MRIGLSGLPLSEHYRLGRLIARAVEETGRRVVLIASGDLSHKLQSYGPYGFAPEGPEYDSRIMDVCGRAAFGELFDFDESFCDKAAECGHRSFVIMAGVFDGLGVRATVLSHQDVTGVGYGVCSFYPEGPDEDRHFLKAYQERTERTCREKAERSDAWVKLARASVEAWVRQRKRLSVPDGLPEELLNRRAGAFVSLHRNGRLRGCIGTIMATRKSVAEEILQNAVSACSQDPRFSPVTEEELSSLEISVDVLGDLDPIEKKPLARFFPGSRILSVGSFGCNLRCPFCQNHDISWSEQAKRYAKTAETVSPEELAELALATRDRGNIGLAFTYNEPLIGYEFVRDTARLAKAKGLKIVMVTNGTAELAVLEELKPYVDAMNVDLKGFTDRYYKEVLGGDRRQVMAFIEEAVKTCHLELTTLIVPGENDSEEEMRELSRWVSRLNNPDGESIPLHISRFFPRFHMQDRGATPVRTVYRLAEVAREALQSVYTGNC